MIFSKRVLLPIIINYLSLYRLETLKMAVHKRHQEAFDDLQKGSIKLAVEKYRQTVEDLEDYE